MGSINKRIEAFVKLGDFLSQFSCNGIHQKKEILYNDLFFDGFIVNIKLAETYNGWFTEENVLYALNSWSKLLTKENLRNWLSNYDIQVADEKKVAIIMAGNIPMVGFHDFLSVLLTGHCVLVKLASNDKQLLPFLASYLEKIEPSFTGKIEFTDEKLTDFDAVIATGSNNTARYFEYYFGNKPHIIRKNRNGVAILSGKESSAELKALGEDIFRYYGLGCRNVSKVFVPKNYDFDLLFKAIYPYKTVLASKKYQNNYDYNKTIYLMSEFNFIENGFLMLKEDESYSSPIATLFYEDYDDVKTLEKKLQNDSEHIQCIVSKGFMTDEISFGKTQQPKLWEYADGVDTVEFLLKKPLNVPMILKRDAQR